MMTRLVIIECAGNTLWHFFVRSICNMFQYSEVQARAVNCLETFLSFTLDQKQCQISMTDNLHHTLRPDEDTCLFTVEDFRKVLPSAN